MLNKGGLGGRWLVELLRLRGHSHFVPWLLNGCHARSMINRWASEGKQDLAVLQQRGRGSVHLPLLVGQLRPKFVVFTDRSAQAETSQSGGNSSHTGAVMNLK